MEEEETSSNDSDHLPVKRQRRAVTMVSTPSKVTTSPATSLTGPEGSQISGSENRSPQIVTRPIFQPHAHSVSPPYSTLSYSLVSPGSSPAQKKARPKSSPQLQPSPQGFHRLVTQPNVPQGGYQNPQSPPGTTSNISNYAPFHKYLFSLVTTVLDLAQS